MTGLLGGTPYTMNQASYDLARRRVNGLIARIPAKNRDRLTSDGLRFAIFYTKPHDRLLRPLLAADQPPAPPPLRKSLHTIDIHINDADHHDHVTRPGVVQQRGQAGSLVTVDPVGIDRGAVAILAANSVPSGSASSTSASTGACVSEGALDNRLCPVWAGRRRR